MIRPNRNHRAGYWIAIAVAIAAASSASHKAQARPAMTPAAAAPAAAEPARFTVETLGSGPDVILIPGLNTPREVWRPTAEALKGQYRLHLVQIRGFGDDAGANGEGPVLAPFVAELAGYIRAQKLDHPAIIGHSLGGLAALMLAADNPALPGRVMVVDAAPFIGTLFDPAATAETMRPRAEAMRAMILARASDPHPAPRDCAAVTGEVPVRPGAMARSAQAACQIGNWMAASDAKVGGQAMVDDMTTDMRPRLPAITAPLTVLHAEDERAMPPAEWARIYREAYAGAKQARLVPVPGAAHFVMLDRPEASLAAIRDFLAAK